MLGTLEKAVASLMEFEKIGHCMTFDLRARPRNDTCMYLKYLIKKILKRSSLLHMTVPVEIDLDLRVLIGIFQCGKDARDGIAFPFSNPL